MSSPRDLSLLTSWHADWSELRVAVLGLGVTGFSVADTLAELGARVLVVAAGADELRIKMVDVIGASFVLEKPGIDIPQELVEFEPELIVVSPGYHPDHAILALSTQRGIPCGGISN